jgi:hypothetical protein
LQVLEVLVAHGLPLAAETLDAEVSFFSRV